MAIVGRLCPEIEFRVYHRALPLADKSLAMNFKILGQRLEQLGDGALVAAPAGDSNGKLAVIRLINFSSQGDVAVFRPAKFPIHPEIILQILPAIAGANVTHRAATKSATGRHDHVHSAALGMEQISFADFTASSGIVDAVGGQ